MPRVRNIEISEKNTKLRWILAGVFLLIGLVALGFGVNSFFSAQEGWQEVEVTANETNCGDDFVLNYCFGKSGMTPTAERKRVAECYNQAVVDAWKLFNTEISDENMGGLDRINRNPNKAVSVDPGLYRALQQIVESGTRYVYLAPVYEEYLNIFNTENELEAAHHDPVRNEAISHYLLEVTAFANDASHISLELQENNKVLLHVSEDYLAFAAENEFGNFLDFGWMKNAFIIDFLAQRLVDAGHTTGYLASFDGFTRNLDKRGEQFNYNLFDRLVDSIFLPAVLQYDQPMSIVFLRDYPMSSRDKWSYRTFADKWIVTSYADPTDGLYRCATDSLVAYSTERTCGEIALAAAPLFIAEDLDPEVLNRLTADDIYCIWFVGRTLHYNDRHAKIAVQKVDGEEYKSQLYK